MLDTPSERRGYSEFPGYGIKVHRIFNPGGLTGIWAEANVRGELFKSMRSKETFATSGTRIKVRLFAGQGFQKNHESYEALVADGYENGVPMGGDIQTRAGAPEFLIWAVKDPVGTNLDQIQIIKGWYEAGELKEKIYTVAASDNRQIQADGAVIPTSATVDLETGKVDDSKGAITLSTWWQDPAFDPQQEAFYYVRVIENPSLRWSAWDKIRYGTQYPKELPDVIQERAWSSPVWYTPQ